MSGSVSLDLASGQQVATNPDAVGEPSLLPVHNLGPVADDWAAAEVWLNAIANRERRGSPETVATYRFHLAKLRWYCEHVAYGMPSTWSVQDVDAFLSFLREVPPNVLCARVGKRYAKPGEGGYTPFRTAPSASSRADIARFVHALFTAWRDTGYVRLHPMRLHGATTARKVNATRSISLDLFDCVLDHLTVSGKRHFSEVRQVVRDRFIFLALRELGLRTSELIGAEMGDIYPLSDPQTARTYWILHVREEHAKGGHARKIPLTQTVMTALTQYREAFGMPAKPAPHEKPSLILSPRTSRTAKTIAGRPIPDVASRRFFKVWAPVTTRQGLYRIVKTVLADTADGLEAAGQGERAESLRQASPHWLRHTFAKAALLAGQDIRHVAAWLGHRDLGTTMVYTEQEALDLIRQAEQKQPGVLAQEGAVSA